MSNTIHCPECDSVNVECVCSPDLVHHHVCHDCGHSNKPVPADVALAEAGDWIVHALGVPLEQGTDTPPPPALLNAILRVIHSDRTGTLHGNELSFPEVVAWVNDESHWAAASAGGAPEKDATDG